MARQHSWLDRMALAMFTTKSMWLFFLFMNLFFMGWIGWNEWAKWFIFDPAPYPLLNLVLAFFVAEMDVIIVIAQIVAGYRADEQTMQIISLVTDTERQTDLLISTTETMLIIMRAVEAMGLREEERDAILHEMIRDGARRGDILDELIVETKR
jgi:uncharacterized membrane protein